MTKTANIPAHEIRSLTNQELVHKIGELTKEERRITIEVLRLLREIERRQAFAELGYPSLFAYCTKALRYSEAAACRRIEAMRAMRETPEIETKLETGELSLSAVTQARTTIRHHEKFAKSKLTPEKRKDVMLSLCGQSKRQTEKALALEFSVPLPVTPVVQRETARGTTRVTIEFTEDEMKVFEEIRRLSGRPQNLKEALLRMAAKELTVLRKSHGEITVRSPSPAAVKREAVPKDEPLSGKDGEEPSAQALAQTPTSTPAFASASDSVSIFVKRYAWKKSGGRCEFRTESGVRCEARHGLEYDHVVPVSLGGLSNKDNIRVYCRQHNLLSATYILGRKCMAKYVPSMR